MACRSRLLRARSYRMVVRGSAWEAASCTSRSETPASSAAVMNACRSVWPDRLGEPGAAGDPADDPPGTVPVQPAAIGGQEDRSLAALAEQLDQHGRDRYPADSVARAAL